MLRSWTTVLVTTCLVAWCTAAGPARAATSVTLQPAASGEPALRVEVRGAQLCLARADEGSGEQPCGDPNARDDDAALLGTPLGAEGRGIELDGLVPAGAAQVEVALRGGGIVRVPAVPAPAGAPAAVARVASFRLRVAVPAWALRPDPFEDTLPQEPVWLRVRDAAGTVIGVAQVEPRSPSTGRRTTAEHTRTLARRGRARLQVRTYDDEVLAPTVAQLDRTVPRSCLKIEARSGGSSSTSGSCVAADAAVELGIVPLEECAVGRAGLQGIVPAGTTGVTAVLGSGRRVQVPLLRLGPALGGRLGVAWLAPADAAVRAVVLAPSGQRLAFAQAPATVACAGAEGGDLSNESYFLLPDPSGPGSAPAALLEPAATVATAGDLALTGGPGPLGTLCLAVGRTALRADDCRPLSRAPGATLTAIGPVRAGRQAVGGVTGLAAPSVEITVARTDGRLGRTRVPTVPVGSGVGAAAAGRARAFVTLLPRGARLLGVAAQSASGTALPTAALDDDIDVLVGGSAADVLPSSSLSARRIGRVSGAVAWSVRLVTDATSAGRLRCAALTAGRRPTLGDLQCAEPSLAVRVGARCAPARLTASVASRGGRRLAVTGRDGRRVPVRRFAVGGGVTFQVADLGASRGLGSVELTGAGGRRVAVGAPAARAQCGYDTEVDVAARR